MKTPTKVPITHISNIFFNSSILYSANDKSIIIPKSGLGTNESPYASSGLIDKEEIKEANLKIRQQSHKKE